MLSLQDKLDQIAREREVLAVQQALAQQGLCDGDAVRHTVSGLRGQVKVDRLADPPAAVVQTVSGAEPYVVGQWLRAQPEPET